MPLAPPQENTYSNFEACFQDVQALAKAEGYAVVAHPKRKNVNGQWARYEIRCDKSGVYRSQAKERVRRPRDSKKTGCPFSCSAILYGGLGNPWDLKVNHPEHNHPASSSPAAHVVHRQDELKAQNHLIVNGVIKGDSTRVIHETIERIYPGTITRYYDIDNAIQALKRNHRDADGQFSVELLRSAYQPSLPPPVVAEDPVEESEPDVQELGQTLIGRPNTRVNNERRARKVEDRLRVLERITDERQDRLARLEVSVGRIEMGVQRIIDLLESPSSEDEDEDEMMQDDEMQDEQQDEMSDEQQMQQQGGQPGEQVEGLHPLSQPPPQPQPLQI